MQKINREFKDRLFRKIFGEDGNKTNLLQLYNALNETNHTEVDELEIYTLGDSIFMGYKNDVSCIIDSYMSLYEQQSTVNPNMPLRGFLYFARMYEKYINQYDLDIYSTRLCKIPAPRYYVFYNGTADMPDRTVLRLSDAFQKNTGAVGFEWTSICLNINYGHNNELLNKCKPLNDYSVLVHMTRVFSDKSESAKEAVEKAVSWCIENDVMSEYLKMHRAEVEEMVLSEYNEEKTLKNLQREAFEDGVERGIEQGIERGMEQGRLQTRIDMIAQYLKKGGTAEMAKTIFEATEEELKRAVDTN